LLQRRRRASGLTDDAHGNYKNIDLKWTFADLIHGIEVLNTRDIICRWNNPTQMEIWKTLQDNFCSFWVNPNNIYSFLGLCKFYLL
jgi:hypothetical protein